MSVAVGCEAWLWLWGSIVHLPAATAVTSTTIGSARRCLYPFVRRRGGRHAAAHIGLRILPGAAPRSPTAHSVSRCTSYLV